MTDAQLAEIAKSAEQSHREGASGDRFPSGVVLELLAEVRRLRGIIDRIDQISRGPDFPGRPSNSDDCFDAIVEVLDEVLPKPKT